MRAAVLLTISDAAAAFFSCSSYSFLIFLYSSSIRASLTGIETRCPHTGHKLSSDPTCKLRCDLISFANLSTVCLLLSCSALRRMSSCFSFVSSVLTDSNIVSCLAMSACVAAIFSAAAAMPALMDSMPLRKSFSLLKSGSFNASMCALISLSSSSATAYSFVTDSTAANDAS